MTRRQLTDPFGSDDEEDNIQIVDDKWSQSISITKSQTPVRDVSIHEIAQIIAFYTSFPLLHPAAINIIIETITRTLLCLFLVISRPIITKSCLKISFLWFLFCSLNIGKQVFSVALFVGR